MWLQPDQQFMEKLQRSFKHVGEECRFWTDLSVTANHINNPSAGRLDLSLTRRLAYVFLRAVACHPLTVHKRLDH